MTVTADPSAQVRTVSVTIDGRELEVPEGTTIWTAAKRRRHRHPGAVPRRALRPGGRVPDVRGRDRRAGLRRGLRTAVRGRHGGHHHLRRDRAQPGDADRAAGRRPAGDRRTTPSRRRPATTCCSSWPTASASDRRRPAARLRARHRPVQPGDRGRPRLLHPVRPLRAGLRRHPGQRRDRAHRQGLRHPDRLRPRRPDGLVVVRHLRRVRRRLPHRCADQQADQRRARSSPRRSSTRSTASAPTAGSGAR